MRQRKLRTVSIEQEREIEANEFAIEMLLYEYEFRRAVAYILSAPERPPTLREGIDLLDDPAVKMLARRFATTEQLVIIRLCQLGYFEPYVRGRER